MYIFKNKLSEIRNKRSNDIIRKRIKECSEIDSILNFDKFRDLIISWKKDPYFMVQLMNINV